MTPTISPFLYPGAKSSVNKLSIVHLKRDLQTPTILRDRDDEDEGYDEGKVVNTRFGSFPHSTLIDASWGSQIRASHVDTGSRGRRGQPQENKRKRAQVEAEASVKKQKLETGEGVDPATELTETTVSTPARDESEVKGTATGFIHLLPPTPENWTGSLPHRTQVVYTPDYSYILHRIRARPGAKLIEAGAGSGSFTHASARAVFSGYPDVELQGESETQTQRRKLGKVWSYEFHEQRHEKLAKELHDHGMDGVVEITHRDVCEEGFLVDGKSPLADSIFLDLPAPWLALPHLARSRPSKSSNKTNGETTNGISEKETQFISPLNPKTSTYICTFSPCIEQVTKTVSVMRQLGWVDIEMVEVSAKRIDVRRERVGLDSGDQRGTLNAPANVDEAVSRLLEIEGNFRTFHANGGVAPAVKKEAKINPNSKAAILESLVEGKVYKDGRLIHRTEPEIRTHTSYLVFAVLPMEWSAEDEERAAEKWPLKPKADGKEGQVIGMSRRQMKKAEAQARKDALTAAPVSAQNGDVAAEE